MSNEKLPLLLTEKQASELAGIRPRTWRRWTRSGLAPKPVFIGRGERPAVRFRRDEILEWIEAGCPMIDR